MAVDSRGVQRVRLLGALGCDVTNEWTSMVKKVISRACAAMRSSASEPLIISAYRVKKETRSVKLGWDMVRDIRFEEGDDTKQHCRVVL